MKLALIGVGGAGGRIVDQLVAYDQRMGGGVVSHALAVDTDESDLSALERVPESGHILLGADEIGGEGTGGDVQLAASVVQSDTSPIENAVGSMPVDSLDAFLIVAGLGGGTGGGVAPVLARLLSNTDTLPVVGLCVLPDTAEGEGPFGNAALTFRPFFEHADGLLAFDADAVEDADVETVVRRFGPLFRTGSGLESTAVLEAITAGVATAGYAKEEVEADDSGGLISRFTGGGDDGEDVDRLTNLVRESALGDLTLEANADSATTALVVASGPEDHLPEEGVRECRDWLDEEFDADSVRAGSVPIEGDIVSVISLFGGVTDAPRLTQFQKAALQRQAQQESQEPEPEDLPSVVVADEAVSGARLNEGARIGVAVLDGGLTGSVADRTVGPLAKHGGQALLVGGEVSERAKRTLAESGITAVSFEPSGTVREVARAIGARPLIDGANLTPDALGRVDGIEQGTLRERLALVVRDTDGSVLATANREGAGPTEQLRDQSGRRPPIVTPQAPSVDLSGGDAQLRQVLGKESNAEVREARTPGGEAIAVKFPDVEDADRQAVQALFDAVEDWESIDDHGNVTEVIDYGTTPRPWIAIEYMDGGSLRERIDLPLEKGAWVTSRAAAALDHAHREGVTHLAVRPENVMFRKTPPDYFHAPKVTDWGVSALLFEQSGGIEGYPTEYSAPEQLDDTLATDERTDLYQLGLVCYELFTGELPFEGLATGVMDQIFNEDPDPPSERNPDLPEAVDDVVLPALAKRKQDRYDDAAAFREALESLFQ